MGAPTYGEAARWAVAQTKDRELCAAGVYAISKTLSDADPLPDPLADPLADAVALAMGAWPRQFTYQEYRTFFDNCALFILGVCPPGSIVALCVVMEWSTRHTYMFTPPVKCSFEVKRRLLANIINHPEAPPKVKARAYFFMAREFAATSYLSVCLLEESIRLDSEFASSRLLLASYAVHSETRGTWELAPFELALSALRINPRSTMAAIFFIELFRDSDPEKVMAHVLLEVLTTVSGDNLLWPGLIAQGAQHSLFSLDTWSPRRHMCIDRHHDLDNQLYATFLLGLNRLVGCNTLSVSDPFMWEDVLTLMGPPNFDLLTWASIRNENVCASPRAPRFLWSLNPQDPWSLLGEVPSIVRSHDLYWSVVPSAGGFFYPAGLYEQFMALVY